MKLSDTHLQTFLAARINLAENGPVVSADLYTFVLSSGRACLNELHTPAGAVVTITPPADGLSLPGKFAQDMGARETNGDCLQWVSGSPASGQYAVNNSTGTYQFGDSNPKLLYYAYGVGSTYGLPSPTIVRLCSADRNVTAFGQTFYSAGTVNNPGGTPQPAIQRSKVRVAVGSETTTLDVDILAIPQNTLNGVPILQMIANGAFDGAAVYVQRLIMPAWGTPVPGGVLESGLTILFSGTVGKVKAGRSKATITVNSRTELLDLQMPRRLFGPGCGHVLFDVGCTLNPATYLATGAAQSGSDFSTIKTNLNTSTYPGPLAAPASAPTLGDTTINNLNLNPTSYWVVVTYVGKTGETTPSPQATRNLAKNRLLTVTSPSSVSGATGYNVYAGYSPGNWMLQNAAPIAFGTNWTENGNGLYQGMAPPTSNNSGWFDLGVICFTSGALAGQWRPVSQYLGDGSITVVPAFAVAPSAGDAFNVLPGCNRTVTTCSEKFDNLINVGAFPFIPSPEIAV